MEQISFECFINELDIRGGTHKQVLRLCEYLIRKGEDVVVYTKKFDINKKVVIARKNCKKLFRQKRENYKIPSNFCYSNLKKKKLKK